MNRKLLLPLTALVAAALAAGCGGSHAGAPSKQTGPSKPGSVRWTDEAPAWSPDGREVVFASDRTNPHSYDHPRRGGDALYVMNADGSHVRRLTSLSGDAHEPSFSPDGKRIVYAGSVLDASGKVTDSSGIYTISAKGANVRSLTPGLKGDSPAWSPDGRWIAFVGPGADLYVVRPDGTDRHRLAINIDASAFSGSPFAWSPDASEIAVVGADERLYRISVDAREPVRARRPEFAYPLTVAIAWSPDGHSVAYVRGELTGSGGSFTFVNSRVWLFDLRTHDSRGLSVDGDLDASIAWLKGPRPMLAVCERSGIRLVGAGGRSHAALKFADPTACSASPNGKKLLFLGGGDGNYYSAIYVAAFGSTHPRKLSQLGPEGRSR